MNAQKMAELFDIDIDMSMQSTEPSDYGNTVSSELKRSFDECCKDVKAVMIPEKTSQLFDDKSCITNAIKMANKKNKSDDALDESDEDMMALGDKIIESVDRDIEEFNRQSTIEDQATSRSKNSKDSSHIKSEPQPHESGTCSADTNISDPVKPDPTNPNPLELVGDELRAYQLIKKKFPQFSLYDGNRAFRDFYRYKLRLLMTLLKRFKMLDLQSMTEEIRDIDLDHFVDSDTISPDQIRIKLNDAYKWRTRLSSLLIDVFEQSYAWKRWLEMCKSKLWKDHDLKGTHRRDGLTMEHLSDIEQYVEDMQGFIESGKHVDNMLKAASDSLSRQLTCLQMKEQYAVRSDEFQSRSRTTCTDDARDEQLDTVDQGTLISAPGYQGEAQQVTFGAVNDELSNLI